MPGQAENERVAARPEGERLARLDRDTPEHLLDAELPLDLADEIVLADRDAARRDEDVALETTLERLSQRRLVVGNGRRADDLRARDGQRSGEHERVRLVDLPGLERLARRDELAAGGKDRHARPTRARDRGDADSGDPGERSRREPRAGRCDDVAGANVPAERPDAGPWLERTIDLYCVVLFDNHLYRSDGVGAFGHDRAGRDRNCIAWPDRPGERRARRRLADDPQCSRQVGGAHRVPVHRRARERREVDDGSHVLGQDATRGGADRAPARPARRASAARIRACASSKVSSDSTT